MTEDTRTDGSVTVIGLGPMGQAMARTYLAAGHPTTVWNRTPSRAEALTAEGADHVATPAFALSASELIVLSLTDYQAMYDILGTAESSLAGKVIVNLSSDTPERSREAAAWVAERGGTLLVGGIMVPAPMVGTEAAYVYYSGPRETFDAVERRLALLGQPRYVGTDPGLAQLYYQAQLTVFLTTLSGLLQATALVGSAGVTAAEFLPQAFETLSGTPAMAEGSAELLDSGEHPGDLSTVLMMGATADHIIGTSETAGIDLELPRAIQSHYARTIDAGHGLDNWTRLYDVIKNSG